jgi:hypothetical protein
MAEHSSGSWRDELKGAFSTGFFPEPDCVRCSAAPERFTKSSRLRYLTFAVTFLAGGRIDFAARFCWLLFDLLKTRATAGRANHFLKRVSRLSRAQNQLAPKSCCSVAIRCASFSHRMIVISAWSACHPRMLAISDGISTGAASGSSCLGRPSWLFVIGASARRISRSAS